MSNQTVSEHKSIFNLAAKWVVIAFTLANFVYFGPTFYAYIILFCVVLVEKESQFVRFYAVQNMFFFVVLFLYQLILIYLTSMFSTLEIAVIILNLVYTAGLVILMLIMFLICVNAYNWKMWKIPLIGNYTLKYMESKKRA